MIDVSMGRGEWMEVECGWCNMAKDEMCIVCMLGGRHESEAKMKA